MTTPLLFSLVLTIIIPKLNTDPTGLKVGDKAPDFIVIDQFDREIQLSELLEENKVVLTFYRGAWCRYCMKQLLEVQDSLSLIHDKGARFVALSPEPREGILKSANVSGADFVIARDEGLEIMQAYDVISDEKVAEYKLKLNETGEDLQHKYLPIPTTYIIGMDRTIEFVYFEPNYKVRVSVEKILKELSSMD